MWTPRKHVSRKMTPKAWHPSMRSWSEPDRPARHHVHATLEFPDRRGSRPATVPPLFKFKDGPSAKPVDGDLTQPTLPERAQNAQPLSAAPLLSSVDPASIK